MSKVKTGLMIILAVLMSSMVPGLNTPDVEQRLEQWMTATYPVDKGRWEVWLLQADAQEVPTDLLAWKIESLENLNKPKKIMNFKLMHEQESITIKARVACYKKVIVAKKMIPRANVIELEDWQWEERLASTIPFDAISDESLLQQSRVKKVLTRREIITRHAIEPQPAVLAGKRLTLKIKGEGIEIKTDVTSLEEGHLGEWIKLKQCETGAIVKAEVIHPELTQIVLNRRQ